MPRAISMTRRCQHPIWLSLYLLLLVGAAELSLAGWVLKIDLFEALSGPPWLAAMPLVASYGLVLLPLVAAWSFAVRPRFVLPLLTVPLLAFGLTQFTIGPMRHASNGGDAGALPRELVAGTGTPDDGPCQWSDLTTCIFPSAAKEMAGTLPAAIAVDGMLFDDETNDLFVRCGTSAFALSPSTVESLKADASAYLVNALRPRLDRKDGRPYASYSPWQQGPLPTPTASNGLDGIGCANQLADHDLTQLIAENPDPFFATVEGSTLALYPDAGVVLIVFDVWGLPS
jgi:hypothetical protein